jgi:hypothetical protein
VTTVVLSDTGTPKPQLAATGPVPWAPYAGAAAILVLAGAALVRARAVR